MLRWQSGLDKWPTGHCSLDVAFESAGVAEVSCPGNQVQREVGQGHHWEL